MKGHEQLVALRRSGRAPDWVFIDIDDDEMHSWDDWDTSGPKHASLLVESKDKRPDMRCVSGLHCLVQGEDRERVFAVRDACIKVGATRVIASVTISRASEFRTVEVTDTDGKMDYVESSEAAHG